MANLSEAELQETVSIMVAAHEPITLEEIEGLFDRAGYQVTREEIIRVLRSGPFRKLGKRWEFEAEDPEP